MTTELTEVLRGYVASETRSAGTTDRETQRQVAELTARVARRRARRSVATVLSAAAAAAVGVSLTFGADPAGDPRPAQPAVPPAASARPTPEPSVTPAPEPVVTAAPAPSVAPAAHPSLPAAEPMPPGLLDSTDSGWRLVRYQAQAAPDGRMSPAGVYLVGADGRVHQVPVGTDAAAWHLQDWLPGTSLAIVQMADGSSTHVMDLLTATTVLHLGPGWVHAVFVGDGTRDVLYSTGGAGSVTPRRVTLDGVVRASAPAVRVADGAHAWTGFPGAAHLVLNDATGPRVLTVADFSTVTALAPYPDRPDACRAWSWLSETEVLLECARGGAARFSLGTPTEFWLAPVSGAARLLERAPDATRLGGIWLVGDRLVAGTLGPTETEAAWWDLDGGTGAELSRGGTPDVTVVDVRGTEVLAVTRSGPAGEARTSSLVAIDPVSGAHRTLLTTPAGVDSSFAVAPRPLSLPQTHIGD